MKKIIVFLLSLTITFTPSLVFATSMDLGGWSITSKVAQGSSMLINASKTVVINGANIAKTSTALIKPTVGQVSKILLRGGAGYALSIAVEQLLGAVDWVLDPANSRISYKTAANSGCTINPNFCKYTYDPGYSLPTSPTAYDACNAVVNFHNTRTSTTNYKYDSLKVGGSISVGGVQVPTAMCVVRDQKGNRTFEETMYPRSLVADDRPRDKHISIDTVAQKVIDNAETSTDDKIKTGAQTVTIGAADEALATDSATKTNVIQQFETNSKTQTNEDVKGETKPIDSAKPELGDALSLKFPVFCSWAPVVCEAAQTAISFPQTLTSWWDTSTKSITESWTTFTDFMNWTKKEPDKSEKENVDIDTPVPFDTSIFTKDRFQVSRQCPVPEQHTINLSDISVNFAFDMSPLCRVLELARPALVACSYLYAAYIVIGAARNG